MAFFEQRISPRITSGARGGPKWSTTVSRTASGRRQANRNWAYPLHGYDVSHGLRSNEDFEELRAFFYVVCGMADGFRYKDWADYKLTPSNSRLVPVTGSVFQVHRVYAVGAREFLRPVQKPVAGTIEIIRSRSGVTGPATAAVDATTGRVTVDAHQSGDTYTCAGEFDVPVAFTSDAAQIEHIKGTGRLYANWQGVTVEEIRL